MEKLEEVIGDSVRPMNKFESQGGSIQDSCETSNDIRYRDLGSEESTREEVGCGGNDDVKMDEWRHQLSWTELGMKELEGQRRWEKYPIKCRREG